MYVFYVFLRFFQNPKKHDFLRFFELLHTFSRTVAAAVSMGTNSVWGKYCYVTVCSAAQSASAPTGGGEKRGGAYLGGRPPAAC